MFGFGPNPEEIRQALNRLTVKTGAQWLYNEETKIFVCLAKTNANAGEQSQEQQVRTLLNPLFQKIEIKTVEQPDDGRDGTNHRFCLPFKTAKKMLPYLPAAEKTPEATYPAIDRRVKKSSSTPADNPIGKDIAWEERLAAKIAAERESKANLHPH